MTLFIMLEVGAGCAIVLLLYATHRIDANHPRTESSDMDPRQLQGWGWTAGSNPAVPPERDSVYPSQMRY
jgi:hypothetical protein